MTESRSRWHNERILFHRFGMGPLGRRLPVIDGNPRNFARKLLDAPDNSAFQSQQLPSYSEACGSIGSSERASEIFDMEIIARVNRSMQQRQSLHERLVLFWSNFFGISALKGNVSRATVGQWERDVIRPNVLGSYSDMLAKTVRHPAFIHSLDNQDSVSPLSSYGRNSGVGFNENMGRELLELYTLSNSNYYTQDDVKSMSLAFCGWSFTSTSQARTQSWGGNPNNLGQFIFQSRWSHPDSLRIMGNDFNDVGENRCKRIIEFLATHEATAANIARRLCEHFISDNPSSTLVNRLTRRFVSTRGNLYEVTRELLEADEAWSSPLQKVRTPYETFISCGRALKLEWHNFEMRPFLSALRTLQNHPWLPYSPAGFPDKNMN